MIKSLSEPDWIDDGGADYESMLNYNIKCPYFVGDERCHCSGLKGLEQPSRFDDCYFCKEEWLNSEVDE